MLPPLCGGALERVASTSGRRITFNLINYAVDSFVNPKHLPASEAMKFSKLSHWLFAFPYACKTGIAKLA